MPVILVELVLELVPSRAVLVAGVPWGRGVQELTLTALLQLRLRVRMIHEGLLLLVVVQLLVLVMMEAGIAIAGRCESRYLLAVAQCLLLLPHASPHVAIRRCNGLQSARMANIGL